MSRFTVLALQILVVSTSFSCTEEGCKNSKNIYCENNVIFRCTFISEVSATDRSPNYQYRRVIDCSKYNAECQGGIQGWVPAVENLPMQPNRDFGCVSNEYDCDAGEPSGCYSNATLSCDVTPGLPVITNTTDNGAICR